MKIKVLFSSELEDIPTEVGQLLLNQCRKLEIIQLDIDDIGKDLLKSTDLNKEDLVSVAKEKMESLRASIGGYIKILNRLDDCIGILEGYRKIVEEGPPVTDKKPEESSEEKISDFTDS
jgi:hypothetical protein